MLILLGLLVTIQAVGAPTKTEMVTLTKEQWDSLNSKLELWAYGFLAFLAKEVWEIVKGKGKKLGDIEMKVNQILTKLENVATKDEAREISRNEVKHYHEISG